MQVVVKKPHIRLDGDVTKDLLEFLRRQYGDVEIIENQDDEFVEVLESDWYRTIRRTITPGDNIRVYRELHGMTQNELGKKLGTYSRQNISNMETGHRPISKTVAKRLADLFDVSVEKFI